MGVMVRMARALVVSLVSAVSGDELKLASVSKLCGQAYSGVGAVMQGIAKVVQQHWRAAAGVTVAVIEEDTQRVSRNVTSVNTGA